MAPLMPTNLAAAPCYHLVYASSLGSQHHGHYRPSRILTTENPRFPSIGVVPMLRGGSEGPSEEGDRPIGEPAASPESESQDETDFETADESMSGAKSAASGSSVDFAPNASPTPPEYNGVEYALYCRREYERACAASGDERAYKKNDKFWPSWLEIIPAIESTEYFQDKQQKTKGRTNPIHPREGDYFVINDDRLSDEKARTAEDGWKVSFCKGELVRFLRNSSLDSDMYQVEGRYAKGWVSKYNINYLDFEDGREYYPNSHELQPPGIDGTFGEQDTSKHKMEASSTISSSKSALSSIQTPTSGESSGSQGPSTATSEDTPRPPKVPDPLPFFRDVLDIDQERLEVFRNMFRYVGNEWRIAVVWNPDQKKWNIRRHPKSLN